MSCRSVAFEREFATDPARWICANGIAPDVSRRADQRDRHFVGHVECLDQDGFVAFQSGGIFDQHFGELIEAGIVHRS